MDPSDFSRGSIWAMEAKRLEALCDGYQELVASADLSRLQKEFRASGGPDGERDYRLVDGAAVISITGPISKRPTFFSWFFGGTDMVTLTRLVSEALADADADAVVLDIDSPGGTLGGLEAFADLVFAAREKKPVAAFANGMMASAAYWTGSAAALILAENTAEVGSIGVLQVHYDLSEMDKKIGIKRTFLSSAPFKVLGNSAEPLSQPAREMIQGELDYLHGLFADTVARHRGMTADAAASIADGRIYIGRQALDAGLIDGIGDLDAAVQTALSLADSGKTIFTFLAEEKTMDKITLETLRADAPDLVAQLRDEGRAEAARESETKTAEAVTAESVRILGLAAVMFGEEDGAKFTALVESGITVDQYKAVKGASGDKEEKAGEELKARILAELQNEDKVNLGPDGKPLAASCDDDFMALVEEYRTKRNYTKGAAIQAVAASHPEAHQEWLKKAQSGQHLKAV